jgi:hypothetical protein
MSATIDLSALKDILLLETHIAGLFAADIDAVTRLHQGQRLRAERELQNEHDPFAIALYTTEGVRVGYLPRSDNTLIARLMDAGKQIEARVSEVATHGIRLVAYLHIFLRDR